MNQYISGLGKFNSIHFLKAEKCPKLGINKMPTPKMNAAPMID